MINKEFYHFKNPHRYKENENSNEIFYVKKADLDFFKEQLLEFKKTRENKEKIKYSLIKNEKIASQDLACFLIDYLDYSENETDNINLSAYRNENYKIEIFVNRQDFENLIEFK